MIFNVEVTVRVDLSPPGGFEGVDMEVAAGGIEEDFANEIDAEFDVVFTHGYKAMAEIDFYVENLEAEKASEAKMIIEEAARAIRGKILKFKLTEV